MAKSSYLDRLINGKLPKNVYEDRYLSNLWDIDTTSAYATYRRSLVNRFSDETVIAITGSDYLNNMNTNQTVLDMENPWLSTITLDSKYLPKLIKNTIGEDIYGEIKAPAEYMPAWIISKKRGLQDKKIPVLFPSSFSRSISSSFAKENPIGSTSPIMAYSYTDGEEIPMEFDALVDYLPEGYGSLNQYVEDIIGILKPNKSGDYIYEPTVYVEFADISFSGVCTSVNVSYDNLYHPSYGINANGDLVNVVPSFAHAKISCQFTKLGR